MGEQLVDFSPMEAASAFRAAEREANVSADYYGRAGHPNLRLVQEARNFATKAIMHLEKPTGIFLSHKSVNKGMVRRFERALSTLNFNPWLDEKMLKAGADKHRGLHNGMQQSCAAVFFVTPDFKDDGYLKTEIDLAIEEEHTRPGDFKIIPLLMRDQSGQRGTIPPVLKRLIFKEPETEIEALIDLVEALPLQLPVSRFVMPQ
jgi:hypothetical protein